MWAMATDSSEWSHGKVCVSCGVQAMKLVPELRRFGHIEKQKVQAGRIEPVLLFFYCDLEEKFPVCAFKPPQYFNTQTPSPNALADEVAATASSHVG